MADFTLPWEKELHNHRYKYLAMYHAIRTAIRSGTLPAGFRLPATRELARMYGLSRGSVAQAYDMLLSEGYVTAVTGSGTFVSPNVAQEQEDVRGLGYKPEESSPGRQGYRQGESSTGKQGHELKGNSPDSSQGARAGQKEEPIAALSEWGERLLRQETSKAFAVGGNPDKEGSMAEESGFSGRNVSTAPFGNAGAETAGEAGLISFALEQQAADDDFPYAAWRSALGYAARGGPYAKADVFGDAELRAAIAAHLRVSRGIAADPSSICCFSGSMQAIALLSQLLLNEGARAVVEDPGYPGIRRAAAAAGAAVIPAAVDGRGIIPRDWDARVLFVTPGRQFPTGAVLEPKRRQELLDWAERRSGIIIEDDFDSEFRRGGQPSEPLMARASGGRVVFIGSFTKTLFPGLRVGYAVLPPQLVGPVRLAKGLFEPYSPGQLEQRALARFMARGDYERHLRRKRRIFAARYETFCREMELRLGGLFQCFPSYSGLHVYAAWQGGDAAYERFKAAARAKGVAFRDVSEYWLAAHEPAACFFFAHLPEEEMIAGMKRLEEAAKEIWDGRAGHSIID